MQGELVEVGVGGTGASTARRIPRGTLFAPTISFNTSTQTYTIAERSGSDLVFSPSSLISNINGISIYRNTSSSILTPNELTIVNPGTAANGLTFTYLTYGTLANTNLVVGGTTIPAETEFLLFGNTTPFAQRPTSGSGTYTGIVQGRYQTQTDTFGLSGSLNLTADFGQNSVQTNLLLTGNNLIANRSTSSIDFGTLTGIAAIQEFRTSFSDFTNPGSAGFQGTLTSNLINDLQSAFSGFFFGPAAEEVGIIFDIQIPTAANPTTGGVGGGIGVGTRN